MLCCGRVHALDCAGSEYAQYSGYLKKFSVGSQYVEVVLEASSCIIYFYYVNTSRGAVASNLADYLTRLNETLLLH